MRKLRSICCSHLLAYKTAVALALCSLFLAVPFLAHVSSSLAIAQQTQAVAKADEDTDEIARRKINTELELESIKSKIDLSLARKNELGLEIDRLEKDRTSLNRSLIETSTRSRTLEESINRTANRLNELRGDEDGLRDSLSDKKALLIEVIAALQRMGHKPPPALLVRPEDALSSVRSAILLGAVIPEIRAETQILIAELNQLVAVRQDIEATRQSLKIDLEKLAEEETRLTLLLGEKKRLASEAREEMAKQTALAAELAGKATNLSSLVRQLEENILAVQKAKEAARKAEEERLAREKEKIANARKAAKQPDFSDTSRIAPAMAFANAKGLLPKPVSGVEIAAFGKKTLQGDISQGLEIATRNGTRVQSPADGWVIYAGPFRSYKQLLILDVGDDYLVVLAGMDRINVELGQFVLTGEPIGIMGNGRIASTGNVDIGSAKPVLYVEFRKGGKSIDSSPWWVDANLKERNG